MSPRSWLALLVLTLPLPTHAAAVTWVFEGTIAGTYDSSTVTPVDAPELTSLGVVEGTHFTATFTIELDTPDGNASATFGRYDNAVLAVSFAAAGYGFSVSGPSSYSQIVVSTDYQALGAYYSAEAGSLSFANPLFFLEVDAAQPGLFASDAIPSPFPEIGSLEPFVPTWTEPPWGHGSWIVVYGGPSILVGSMSTQYTISEPAAAPLIGFGVLALVALSRRSW